MQRRVEEIMRDGIVVDPSLPLLSVKEITDPKEIVQLGATTARYGISISVDGDDFVFDDVYLPPYSNWFLIPADHGGMQPVSLTSNVKILHFDHRNGRILCWTYGCDHDIVREQKGRCYYEAHCAKCDYGYVVDSSD